VKDMFRQTYKLTKLSPTIPVTSVPDERSFSNLNNNKKLSSQHPGPRTTVILLTPEHQKSSAGQKVVTINVLRWCHQHIRYASRM